MIRGLIYLDEKIKITKRLIAKGMALMGSCFLIMIFSVLPALAADFTIVVLPDTQNYSTWYPDIFSLQTQWIKENRDELHIKFIVHVGDVVNNASATAQWNNANTSLSVLDGEVPYLIVPGNHDYLNNCDSNRNAANYNYYFNYTRFEIYEWYGGHYGGGNENSYGFFTADGIEFLVLGLEFCPRDDVLVWANNVINDHSDKKVIVFTHLYMNYDDTRLGVGDDFNCGIYGCGATCNNGDDIWNELVSNHPNIILVISGHAVGKLNSGDIGSTGRMTDYVGGQPIHQLLQNYQMEMPYGGNGWLRYYTFKPNESIIEGWTYSPYLDEYEDSSYNRFDLIYPQDSDNDGIPDSEDNCPYVFNPGQEDDDSDGRGDVCDNCPSTPNGLDFGTCTKGTIAQSCTTNEQCGTGGFCSREQEDTDSDYLGDVCDECTDTDKDGYGNPGFLLNTCPEDNCPTTPNPDQLDTYPPQGNGIGDACDCEANFDCDADVDANDVTAFLTDFGRNQYNRPCTAQNPCYGDFLCDGDVDASDVIKFLEDFGRSQFNNPCPVCEAGNWCVYP